MKERMKAVTIDFIGEHKATGEVMLIMRQKSRWTGDQRDLEGLQDRVNVYLQFALDGQMAEDYPQFSGRPIRIIIACLQDPPEAVTSFVARMAEKCKSFGVELEHRMVEVPENSREELDEELGQGK